MGAAIGWRGLRCSRSAFHEQQVPTSEALLKELLALTAFHQLDTVSALPRALAVLLAEDHEEEFPHPPTPAPSMPPLPPSSVIEPALFEFAEELSFAEVVPFESSALSLHSLASIALKAARGGATTLGAVTAYVAVGQTPLLLVAVPAGIVLCGGAIAFGKWLDQHRDEIFAKILGIGRKPRRRPSRGISFSDET
jgi:hypothetical protein